MPDINHLNGTYTRTGHFIHIYQDFSKVAHAIDC